MQIVVIYLSVLFWNYALAISPSPVQCSASGCIVRNYLGVWPDRNYCRAAEVVYPRTEQELVSAVAHGAAANLKMKVVSRWSQSIPKLVCPGGDSGLLISTKDLNSDIVLHEENMTVTADAGVMLRDLVDVISESGYALPAATYWDAVSVAGAVSTGAHGSSLWGKGSALHDFLAGMSIVVPAAAEDGFAKVVWLDEGSSKELMDAARVSLGVLGAISKVTFRVEPMFKRSVVLQVVPDETLEERVLEFAAESEFGDICWHPSLRKALFKIDRRVPVDAPGEGVNRYRGFQPMPSSIVEKLRLGERRTEDHRDTESQCKLAEYILNLRVPTGNGFSNDGVNFTGFPVTGYNNLMQTAGGCQKANPSLYMTPQSMTTPSYFENESQEAEQIVDSEICSWDPRVEGSFYHQVAFSVGLDKVKDLILDIKKLRDKDPSSFCGLSIYGGIYLRYLKESTAFLGQKEPAVEFDITFYRASEAGTPRLNEDVVEEIEQMSLFKYEGKPHWGKNRNIAFTSIRDRVRDLDRFAAVKKQLDPNGLFSSEWSDAVLDGNEDGILSTHDHCALEGMCVCSEDRHCAPEQGYFCRRGQVFEAAKVCRYDQSSSATR